MPKALITTIIPTFRRPKLLKRAIESVLLQSFADFKLCVYDNASGDETECIVRDYSRKDDRIIYYKNSENIGAINNMVQGVKAVDTEFYSLLNDDDFLLPDFYKNAMEAFGRYPDAGFVCAKTISADLLKKKLHYRNNNWSEGYYEPKIENLSKMYNSHFVQTSVLLRSSIPQLIGYFEESGDDRLYMLMASACLSFYVLDYYGGVYTIHPNSYSSTIGVRQCSYDASCHSFLSVIDKIMKLNIEIKLKTYLLLMIFNRYDTSFEQMKLNQYGLGSRADVMNIPSFMSSVSFMNKMIEKMPRKLHPLLARATRNYGMKFIKSLKDVVSIMKKNKSLVQLPDDLYCHLTDEDNDSVKQIISLIQEKP